MQSGHKKESCHKRCNVARPVVLINELLLCSDAMQATVPDDLVPQQAPEFIAKNSAKKAAAALTSSQLFVSTLEFRFKV